MSALRKSDQQRLRRLQHRQAIQVAMSNPRHLICGWLDLIEVFDEMADEGTVIADDNLEVSSHELHSSHTAWEALLRIGLVVEKGDDEENSGYEMLSLSSAYKSKKKHHGAIRGMLRYFARTPMIGS
jgi:hypothetical protein